MDARPREGACFLAPPRALLTGTGRSAIGRGLLLFWGSWFSVVFGSNLGDALLRAGWLSSDWPFASGNFALVAQSIQVYSFPEAWAWPLFAGVLLFQLVAAFLFWRALLAPEIGTPRANEKATQAFLVAIGTFAAFLIADEVLIVYHRLPDVERTHLLVLCSLLLSLLVVLSPGRGDASKEDAGG